MKSGTVTVGGFTVRADTLIRTEGMRALNERLGIVEAERFITLIIREPFDYTQWQQDLYNDMTADELFENATETWKQRTQSL